MKKGVILDVFWRNCVTVRNVTGYEYNCAKNSLIFNLGADFSCLAHLYNINFMEFFTLWIFNEHLKDIIIQ